MSRLPALCILLAACSPDDDKTDEGDNASDAVDLRRDIPDPPEGGLQWLSPDMEIPAYTEMQWCYFTSYEGETVGIHTQGMYQSDYGHHVTINATNAEEDDYPDGTLVDCTDPDAVPMTDIDPLFVGGQADIVDSETHTYEFSLPEGMAVRLPGHTRLVVQSHYVNTGADDILVKDGVNVGIMVEDEVETWASAMVHTDSGFSLPSGQETTDVVECTWEQDASIIFLTGHMHEYGTAYKVEWIHGETTETIYEIPTWDAKYRDLPPMDQYEPGVFNVTAGDSFRTSCSWFNKEDHTLEFPAEMCATAMMGYPSKVPVICDVAD